MKKTFKEQFSVIAEAYYQGRLNPYCNRHCFIGYLIDKSWARCSSELHDTDGRRTALNLRTSADVQNMKAFIYKESQGLYELSDMINIERKFLKTLQQHLDRSASLESALYHAVAAGLQELKAVHESKGETCYYEPLAKADYEVTYEDGNFTVIRHGFPDGLVGAILFAVLRRESDEHEHRLRKQQQYN